MWTDRNELSANVVKVSTARRMRRTSPVDDVSRSLPGGPQARAAMRHRRDETVPLGVSGTSVMQEISRAMDDAPP
jgi:hypothetical protein